MPNTPAIIPHKLTYLTDGLNSKPKFVSTILCNLLSRNHFDLIICGHINLIPISYICRRVTGASLALIVHGVDAWHPTRRRITNYLVGKIDALISVSEYTKNRIQEWADLKKVSVYILPNCVDLSLYGTAPKNEILLDRYGLKGKVVLMTLGRLDSKERAKGFDEVMEVLPHLAEQIPDIAYLIVGGGTDLNRLEEKAKSLMIEKRVVFTGLVPETEKADHYRLADAYVMPSRGEGFGIVLLEAMACGIPVVASKLDGSREALRDGMLGILVAPGNPPELIEGIKIALESPRRIPVGLDFFSDLNFQARVHDLLDAILENRH
jgi:glycosyltransferase involved in cell wall biosynthesis